MIYFQRTMVAINKPEDSDDFTWYLFKEGIYSKKYDKYSNKKYIWSDENLENFEYKTSIDYFLDKVRQGKLRYFKIKTGLFSRKERLIFDDNWNIHKSWNIEDIKRVDVLFSYKKQDMTLDEVMKSLDVEEYAKMIKSLGIGEV